MNTIDIIICVLLVYALIKGWSGGILVQIAGIAGILIGFWAATFCSDYVAELLHMENASHQMVYVVTLIIVMVLVIMLLKLLDRILKSVGLSVPLRILGVVFSVGKWMLLLALILSVYLSTIKTLNISPAQIVKESYFYEPLRYVNQNIFPYIAHVKDAIPDMDLKLPKMDVNIPDINIPKIDSLKIDSLNKDYRNNNPADNSIETEIKNLQTI